MAVPLNCRSSGRVVQPVRGPAVGLEVGVPQGLKRWNSHVQEHHQLSPYRISYCNNYVDEDLAWQMIHSGQNTL